MVRGDSKGNMIMKGDHEVGFGFLKDVAIDQHLLRRNRQFDLIQVIRSKPDLLGIGIDEGAAIVVEGDKFKVVGRSYVAIYDHETMGEHGHFYFLAPGDEYDLGNRVARCSRGVRTELWLPQMREKILVRSEDLERYAGLYQMNEYQAEVLLVGERLFGEMPDQGRLEFIPISEHTFYDEGWGRKIVFNVDGVGEVESVTIDDMGGEKVLPKVR